MLISMLLAFKLPVNCSLVNWADWSVLKIAGLLQFEPVVAGPAGCAAPLSISGPQKSGLGETGGDGHLGRRQSAVFTAWHGQACQGMDDEFRDRIIDFGDSGYVACCRLDAHNVIILAVRHLKEAGF